MSAMKSQLETSVLIPENDIVASRANSFREQLKEFIDMYPGELVIDLKNVEMVDSTGLSILIASYNSLFKLGRKLVFINVSNNICKLFSLTRLDRYFSVSGRTAN